MRCWPLLGVLVACSGGTAEDKSPDDPDDSADTESQADTAVPPELLAFVGAPVLSENPHGAGLTAVLTVETSVPSTLELEVVDPDGVRTWTVDEATTTHEHLILGLRPDADHTVTVTARAADPSPVSELVSDPLPWRSEPLPDELPLFEAEGEPTRMEPGLTLVGVSDHVWMLDALGRVVWYLEVGVNPHEVMLTDRGTLQLQQSRSNIREVELSGELVRGFVTSTIAVAEPNTTVVDSIVFHHDVFESADGNLWTLGIEGRDYPDYPDSTLNPAVTVPLATVAGDLVLQLAPDGTVLSRWSLLDRLDPYRVGMGTLGGDFWEPFFPGQEPVDWSHANSVVVDEVRDEVVVSLRHQDAVVGLERDTGEVTWILAPAANWPAQLLPLVLQPALPTDVMPYHQHAASLLSDGHLLMFDNGNFRASAFEPTVPDVDNFSRCLEVSLDHAAGTWTTVWAWGEDLVDNHFSATKGDCDRLPATGNSLVTFGNLKNPTLPGARVYEVTAGGEEVWRLSLLTPPDEEPLDLYRAARIPSVIPGR